MLCGLHPQPLGMATAFGCKEVREALETLLEDAKSEAAAEREVAAESAIKARDDQGEQAAVHATLAKHRRDEAARVAASVAAHVDDAPAVEGKRSVARPTPEMEALLEAKAGLLGLELNLEARREQRPTGLSPRGQDATGHAGRQPSAEDEGDQAPSLHAGVQHTPMLSSYVDEGSIAAFYHSVGNGSNSHTSQLYLAFKQGEEHATAMACDLMTRLGSNLTEVYPELCNTSVGLWTTARHSPGPPRVDASRNGPARTLLKAKSLLIRKEVTHNQPTPTPPPATKRTREETDHESMLSSQLMYPLLPSFF